LARTNHCRRRTPATSGMTMNTRTEYSSTSKGTCSDDAPHDADDHAETDSETQVPPRRDSGASVTRREGVGAEEGGDVTARSTAPLTRRLGRTRRSSTGRCRSRRADPAPWPGPTPRFGEYEDAQEPPDPPVYLVNITQAVEFQRAGRMRWRRAGSQRGRLAGVARGADSTPGVSGGPWQVPH
jgi:hypothetical protein